jgi:signal transduction histidine kinase
VPFRKSFVHPISLRAKLLIGFSMVFSAVFAGTYYWFYTFSTEKAIARLKNTIEDTLVGTAARIDVDELIALYEDDTQSTQDIRTDPRYLNQLDWFQTVHQIEPSVWLYSYLLVKLEREPEENELLIRDRFTSAMPLAPDAERTTPWGLIYLVDLWAPYDASKAAEFRELSVPAGTAARQALFQDQIVHEAKIYTDDWGAWMSAFIPLRDSNGDIVAGLGIDIEANYVFEVQQAIRNRVLASFTITYGVLFTLIYVLSGVLTRHLTDLTESAEQISAGNYRMPLPLFASQDTLFPDEMHRLAQVFQIMVESIRTREQTIRESKLIEDEIRHELQEEKEMSELKSRFVSMVSHELRTPLTIIRTSTELLEKYSTSISAEKRQLYFQRVHTAVSQMTQMLEDVLTFGKTEAGQLKFHPVELNLDTFCREIVEEIRSGIGIHHTIVFSSQSECTAVPIDPALMRAVLTNLLSNAVKYSPQNSPVDFSLSCDAEWAKIQVRDRGIGIPIRDQPRLFELFHRASNTSTIRGTGIGLSIVKQCVARHGGQIAFTSQEGKGTTFTVHIPLTPSPVTDD